ncbi:histidine kinase [Hymenobacter sp. BT683]|uniref:Histidine kinase n=1 Tax=Hymenobacter jeongseonensis TaxID=2791027 RepID=A0ABS0IH03_9BACT|nr:histidine kinase [Hymenobacter jeongseonensis]MBF9237203.1 histidine kinase [Hymenobacter jeongseonensis]
MSNASFAATARLPMPRWLRLGLILLAITVVITFFVNRPSKSEMVVNFFITLAYTGSLWFANDGAVAWLDRFASWRAAPVRRFLLTMTVSLLVSLVAIFLVNLGFRTLYFHQPISIMFTAAVWQQFAFPLVVTVLLSLFQHSRAFLLKWREAAIQTERLEKETAVARLDSLRRQVDPHFLFNSLNALTSLVEENDPARAVRFIRQLSQVYRYVLDSESQELVPLADELKFAESYLFLQKTRLGDALAVEMSLPPASQLAPFFVPPLALQLLLENVIKHNTAFQADPLRISVGLDVASGTLTVRNTLRPRRLNDGEKSGLGLKNLAARYAFLTDKPIVINPENGEFVVTLPLLTL